MLDFLGEAEIVPDMKGRARLIGRVLLFLLNDPEIEKQVQEVIEEIDWNKVKLSKSDKYYLRGKYFKADYDSYDY